MDCQVCAARLLGAGGHLDARDASVGVVRHHDRIVPGRARDRAAVARLLLASPRHTALAGACALGVHGAGRPRARAQQPLNCITQCNAANLCSPQSQRCLGRLSGRARQKTCTHSQQSKARTSSTLQIIVPSGMSPTGRMLPMCSVAFFPAYTNCAKQTATSCSVLHKHVHAKQGVHGLRVLLLLPHPSTTGGARLPMPDQRQPPFARSDLYERPCWQGCQPLARGLVSHLPAVHALRRDEQLLLQPIPHRVVERHLQQRSGC